MTMDRTRIQARHGTWIAAGAAGAGFVFGLDTSTMNSAIHGISANLELGSAAVGFVVAISLIGCAIGAWFAGTVAERLGRTAVMLLAALLLTGGTLGAAASTSAVPLGVCRLLVGLGIGAASAVVPPYITEISPPALRGRLGSLWQLAIIVGQLLGLIVGYGLAAWAGSAEGVLPIGGAAWRWMFVVVAVASIAYAIITRRLPRSPYDLVRSGDGAAARGLLEQISNAPINEQLFSIERAVSEHEKIGTLRDLRGPRLGLKGIVWVGILLAAFQQLVGINVVKTYSTSVWRAVGVPAGSAFAISIVTVAISLASTIAAILVVDRVGRRTMLAAGAALMAVALAAVAIAFAIATGAADELVLGRGAGLVAFAGINVFAIAFGVTWGPVMWLMLGELFTSRIRTAAVAVCVAVNWISNWAVTQTFPLLADLGLGIAYGVYAAFAVLALVFVLKTLPETTGRALS
jgi:SP family sugar:H+ symporter-like MFS transporter